MKTVRVILATLFVLLTAATLVACTDDDYSDDAAKNDLAAAD